MKIRYKLIFTLLLIMLVPIIVMTSVYSTRYSDMLAQAQMYSLKTSNSDKAIYLNEFLRNISSELKNFAGNISVRSYTEHINSGSMSDEEVEQLADDVNKLLNERLKNNSSIMDMFIFDNTGLIISSLNKESVGTRLENYNDLLEISSKNNGISAIYPPESRGGCYFYTVRRIYSQTNKIVGAVCQKIDLTSICDMLSIKGFSNYGTIMIVDSAGKYITSNISIPKSLESIVEYREIPDHISAVIPFYSQAAVKDTITAEYDDNNVCGTAVLSGNWCIVSIYNNNDAKAALKKGFKDGSAILVVVTVVTAAAVIFVCIRFTAPIRLILDVVRRMNKGDQTVRLDISSSDEFGEISDSFNSLVESIYESEQRYRTVVSMTDNIVFEANLKTFKIYVSDNFNQKFSFRASDDSIKESFLYKMKVHKDDAKRYREDVDNVISSSGEKWEGEYRLKNIYGDFTWVKIRVRKFFDRNKSPAKLIGMLTDIDREKKSTITLMQKANYDALTQLYNRATFMRTLDEEMQLSVARRSLDALMFIDLDDFKHFNDEFGHKCGDEVLKFVADTIKEITFDKGFGGRLGGDEFVMCLTNLKLIGDAGKAAKDMINTLDAGFISESCGEKFNIHCSIGIAFFRENGGNSTELLEAADSAMYKIKKSGKSNFTYVSSENASTTISTVESGTFDSTF